MPQPHSFPLLAQNRTVMLYVGGGKGGEREIPASSSSSSLSSPSVRPSRDGPQKVFWGGFSGQQLRPFSVSVLVRGCFFVRRRRSILGGKGGLSSGGRRKERGGRASFQLLMAECPEERGAGWEILLGPSSPKQERLLWLLPRIFLGFSFFLSFNLHAFVL